jgi:uracil-DNA glycosylase
MAAHIGNDWDEIIGPEFKKEYYLNLRKFLISEYNKYTIFPEMHDIFNALKFTAFKDVKVVILGQDPYHSEGQAHGLAFSVKTGVPIPPSLMNIYKEIANETGAYIPNNGCLEKWAEQGVLLLNTALTVRAHQANSHKGFGWEMFTDKIVEVLNCREEPVIFMLWGSNARSKRKIITSQSHVILEAVHPSPLSAYNGFFGCGHFNTANSNLKTRNKHEIDWQISNI